MAMTAEEASKKTLQPLLVKLDKARKLAEKWVTEMGWPADENDKPSGPILEPRPPGLGIGATIPRESTSIRSNMYARSNDPIERKLLATLNAKERKVSNGKRDNDDEKGDEEKVEEESDEEESKSKAFTKRKRPAVPPFLINPKKKHK